MEDDAEAWQLARDAHQSYGMEEPVIVCVGERQSGDNGYQAIYSI
jgi:hypothetical protein